MSLLTRSITQKLLLPLNIQTLSSSGSLKYESEKTVDAREDELLDDRIEDIYIGFEKIGLPIHGFTDYAFFATRIFLPSEIPILSGKTWLHASLLLKTKKGYSICVEYGGYDGEDLIDKNKKSYKTYYWFEASHGLRYAEMGYNTYINLKLDYDSYSKRIFPLECGRNITLRKALRECNQNKYGERKKIWTYENYDLANQNCQDFVAKFIEVTEAYRSEGVSFRGLHNLSSAYIPKVILKAIENNEDDGWNTAGKIPLLGPIIGSFYGIYSKLKNL